MAWGKMHPRSHAPRGNAPHGRSAARRREPRNPGRRAAGRLVPTRSVGTSWLILCLALAGCGGTQHPATLAVSGRVTLGGGEWPVAGRMYFNSLEPAAGFPRHPGMAEFAADGRFTASTWGHGDGLMPGRYKVGVECWKVPPTMGGPPAVSYVADSHLAAARSPIELTVEAGKPLSGLEWDIPRNPKTR